mgnify:FL=1
MKTFDNPIWDYKYIIPQNARMFNAKTEKNT